MPDICYIYAMPIRKYLTIFTAAVTLELLSTLYIQAVAASNMPAVAVLAFLSPLANLPFVGHLVDTKEWSSRIKMALVYGTGYAVGAMIVFLLKYFDICTVSH